MATRVLLVQGTAEQYGSDTSSLVLATGLRDRGYEVTVALGGDGPLYDALADAGIAVERAEPGTPRLVYGRLQWLGFVCVTLPKSIWRIRRLARRADLVHLNTSSMLGALVGARLSRRPTVVHVREWWAHRERAWAVYGKLIVRWSSAVIANGAEVADQFVPFGCRDRVTVVHNGIEFRPRRPRHPRPHAVAMVGRINEWKGHEVVVRAVARLRDRGVDVCVTAAGDVFSGGSHHRETLERLIADLDVVDRVNLPGFVHDVDDLLANSEIYVLPSVRPEPFGLSLIEAMAQGVACIATDAGGPREIVDNGRTGVLVPMGDDVALADALERLLGDAGLRDALGQAAAIEVRARFSAEQAVNGVAAVYDRILR